MPSFSRMIMGLDNRLVWIGHRMRTAGCSLLLLSSLLLVQLALATDLIVTSATATPGQQISLQVLLQPGSHVAGLKMTIGYDADVMTFVRADKLADANGMMYVVNDRQPGKLIVVMAGAKGVETPKVALLDLVFQIRQPIHNDMNTHVHLMDVEAKSDQLKSVPLQLRSGDVHIRSK